MADTVSGFRYGTYGTMMSQTYERIQEQKLGWFKKLYYSRTNKSNVGESN